MTPPEVAEYGDRPHRLHTPNSPRLMRPRSARASATITRLCTLAVLPLLGACGNGTGPNGGAADSLRVLPRALSTTEQQGVTAGNRFALNLLRESARIRPGNVLLSPLSVSVALGMTMNGAEQETLAEMTNTLGWGNQPRAEVNAAYRDLMQLLPSVDPQVTLTIANGVWLRAPFTANAGFVQDVRTFFAAPVTTLPTPRAMFDAVNVWGNERTRGMIPKVLEGDPPVDLVMLLANATYFAGKWRERFDPAKTTPQGFQLENGTSVSVPMMQRSSGFRGANTASLTAIELSYGNSAWSMLMLVPRSGPVAAFAQSLTDATVAQTLAALQPVDGADLFVPRFTVSSNLELSGELKALGMRRAFTPAAQFPRLVDESTQIGFVQHAVKVAVDEAGTRAAAVTAVGIRLVSLPPSYRVDRPFVFFIRERLSGTIAFAGIVRDPR